MNGARSIQRFRLGTTGWTAADLEDREIERRWFRGRHEIVDGVLAELPRVYLAEGEALVNLLFLVNDFTKARGIRARFAVAVDIVVSERRVARCDGAMLLASDSERQAAAARRAGKTDLKRTRILVAPTLVLESVSPGHEDHDLATKRRWYAGFGVPHYWVLDAYKQKLLCLRLEAGRYREEARGRGCETVRPSLFPGLSLELKDIWED
jgi:Uma2 family endonuclease